MLGRTCVGFGLVLLALTAGGCAIDEMRDTVQARAASDFHCAEDKVKVFQVAGTTYRARGCNGESMVYDCAQSAGHAGGWDVEYVCLPERGHSSED